MTVQEAHKLANQAPGIALMHQLGELKDKADREVAQLTMTLKQIDDTTALLKKHGFLEMTVTLGAVGDSAANARRAQLADKGRDVFELPRGAAA